MEPGEATRLEAEVGPEASGSQNRSAFAGKPRQHREVFWNLPNTITMLRIAAVPVMLLIPTAWALTRSGSRFMGWVFILAALSDILDGWLARRGGGADVTRVGKLLDPLADKLLVSTALIMLVAVDRIPVWATVMVVVIVGRELAVTGLRGMASSDGHVVGASWQGKLKSLAQNISVAALLLHYPIFGLPAHEIGLTLLGVATALTFWSGYVYFADYFGWEEPPAS
ncbi:MAG: CDP-diacylglycerol--glycerol-3-phosphate 3-phosphatidyltransferase [bacterium TMED88]|nr:CDP-diacylglycerol--glycerol-3-phosphate 3-phosphatidyltransferase [Deltaproteobacteria bacterium]OUV21653.1 MAG: CDP-diacylglycerol--glycerol-3-phosphate 3-phosphatidyltransferase [bacterium TMED88]